MAAPAKIPFEIADQILLTARERLARGGFRGLTLRPLAQECGLSLAALTYHFSAKARLVERLAQRERQIDRERHAAFAARFADLSVLSPGALASAMEAYLEEAAGSAAQTTTIWTELLLSAVSDTEARAVMQPWIEERWLFWRSFFAGRREGSQAWAASAFGYVTDEAVHSLAQQGLDDYRLLRRMAIERWAFGFPLTVPGLSQPGFFEAVVARLNPALALPDPDAPTDLLKDRRGLIARAAGAVIVLEGAEAITHRAVGERASVPASTVAYHFNHRLDLLRAGLTTLYLAAQGRLELEGVEQGPAVARGTISVALAATRDADLLPFAIDLRRLRGENLYRQLPAMGADPLRFDRCASQAASVLLMGSTLLTQARGAASAADDLQIASVAEWLVKTPAVS